MKKCEDQYSYRTGLQLSLHSYTRSILITYDTAVVEYMYVYIVPYPTIEMIQTLMSISNLFAFNTSFLLDCKVQSYSIRECTIMKY